MANLSDAHGNFTLEGPWEPNHIKVWAYIMLSQDTGSDYSTYLTETDFQKLLDELNGPIHQMSFSAFGRWAYGANLEYLCNWHKISNDRWKIVNDQLPEEYKISYEDYLVLCNWLFDEMLAKELSVVWDYYDMETGCDFMIHVVGRHVSEYVPEHLKNTLVYSENTTESWDCNLKNYCEQFMEGDYEQLDEVLGMLTKLYKLSDEHQKSLEEMIKAHPTWYDLIVYPWYDNCSELPRELDLDIIKRKKGLVPW